MPLIYLMLVSSEHKYNATKLFRGVLIVPINPSLLKSWLYGLSSPLKSVVLARHELGGNLFCVYHYTVY